MYFFWASWQDEEEEVETSESAFVELVQTLLRDQHEKDNYFKVSLHIFSVVKPSIHVSLIWLWNDICLYFMLIYIFFCHRWCRSWYSMGILPLTGRVPPSTKFLPGGQQGEDNERTPGIKALRSVFFILIVCRQMFISWCFKMSCHTVRFLLHIILYQLHLLPITSYGGCKRTKRTTTVNE